MSIIACRELGADAMSLLDVPEGVGFMGMPHIIFAYSLAASICGEAYSCRLMQMPLELSR